MLMPSVDHAITSRPTRFSADELIPFGKYMLLNKIQSGATAAVYRAKIRGAAGFERLVAIKRILPQMSGDPEFVRTFIEEAKTCARLTHENICPIYELGKVGESLYMAMEWLPGKDLGAITRRLSRQGEVMPPLIAAWIASRLCDALDYAHSLKTGPDSIGIIHRDLSPTNIVCSYEGQVKLIDFGLAKAAGRAQQTNVDALKQKLGYMSPELVLGRAPDARSDVFGVGVCLYEMITARRLFAGKDDMATLRMVSNASVPPPSALVEDAPEELELITMRALERAPDDRWSTAGEMGKTLAEFISNTDPMFGPRQVSAFMRKLFAGDMDAEQQRVNELLTASHDEAVLEERKRFFSSPAGAAAIAKAEAARRLSTLPPPVRYDAEDDDAAPLSGRIPKAPRLPRVPPPAGDVEQGSGRPTARPRAPEEEEPTAFHPTDGRTTLVDEEDATRHFDAAAQEEPTTFLPVDEEEKTQYLTEESFADAVAAAAEDGDSVPPGGEDEEELTHIFFNLEEGIGVPELVNEPVTAEAPISPLSAAINDPPQLLDVEAEIVAQNEAAFGTAARRSTPSAIRNKPAPRRVMSDEVANWMKSQTQTERRNVETLELRRTRRSDQLSTILLVVGVVMLLVAVVGLVTKTPVGVKLGLRKPNVASIEVRTSPAVGAAVKLDGIFRGRAPLRLEGVRSGRRVIAVTAEGYQEAARSVDLQGGNRAQVMIELEPLKR
ncbi:MAG TPA: serine/threonine-protein kinase [Polyangiales bacterium]|nr:serine/threonine-protein kinase [Polyangiales bacterium]